MAVIAATNAAVFLDIPVLRQLLAVVFLTVAPGLLLLFTLKLHRLPLAEKLVLVLGLSIAFLMLFGWILNQICITVGYMTPLSTNFLTIALSITLAILLIIAYIINREAFSTLTFQIELNSQSKLCLLLCSIFPLMSILGTRLVNTSGNNIVLMVLLYLIPVAVILIVLQRHKISENTYPIAIVMIAAALLSMFWLRSEHILGHDVHYEYYFFQNTLLNQHWSIFEYATLNSCLSISILPAIYQSLLDVSAQEQLFKGLSTLIGILTPLTVYVLSRKYIREIYAFLAAIFLASQSYILSSAGAGRIAPAFFFFALAIMVLFNNGIPRGKRNVLFLIFMLGTIVSHYTTTYVFFFILLFVFLTSLFLKRYSSPRVITMASVSLFFVLIFLWYSQITTAPFISGIQFVNSTIRTLADFFIAEARSSTVQTIVGGGTMKENPFLAWIHFAVTWASFVFIAIGVIGTFIKHKGLLLTTRWGNSTSPLLKTKFEMEFFLLAIASSGVLVAVILLPFLSFFDPSRFYNQMVIILSPFFVLGGIMLAKKIRVNPYLSILLILIPLYFFNTSALYESFGIHHKSWTLSAKAPALRYEFIYEQESLSAQWLAGHMKDSSQIITIGAGATRKLVSQGGIPRRFLVTYNTPTPQEKLKRSYIYLTYDNVVNGEFLTDAEFRSIDEHSDMFTSKNKLYTNGGSEIWR